MHKMWGLAMRPWGRGGGWCRLGWNRVINRKTTNERQETKSSSGGLSLMRPILPSFLSSFRPSFLPFAVVVVPSYVVHLSLLPVSFSAYQPSAAVLPDLCRPSLRPPGHTQKPT